MTGELESLNSILTMGKICPVHVACMVSYDTRRLRIQYHVHSFIFTHDICSSSSNFSAWENYFSIRKVDCAVLDLTLSTLGLSLLYPIRDSTILS